MSQSFYVVNLVIMRLFIFISGREVLIEQCHAANESTRWSVAGPTFTKKRRWNMAGEATNSTLLFQLTWRPLRALDSPCAVLQELQRNKDTFRCASGAEVTGH